MDHVLLLSIDVVKGEKTICPGIFYYTPDGKQVLLVKCNSTKQCNDILSDIRSFIELGKNYTIPEIEMNLVRFRLAHSENGVMTFYIPQEEHQLFINCFKIGIMDGTKHVLKCSGRVIKIFPDDELAKHALESLETHLNGELNNDDPPYILD